MTLSGEQFQQHARATAASLEGVTSRHPFAPHLEVWMAHGKVFLIVTENDPTLQIVCIRLTHSSEMHSAATSTRSPSGTDERR